MPVNTPYKDGKHHVHTVPVKLCRPQNNQRKPHIDAHFAMASVKYARGLAELFSDEHVFFLSQDDKARVLIGLPVSEKQDVMLMHLEYKVYFARSQLTHWKKAQTNSICICIMVKYSKDVH